MASLNIEHITFDCHDPQLLAAFWAGAMDLEVEGDSDEFARLSAGQGGIHFAFQKVPEGKVAKNRVHLDLNSDNMAETVEKLVGLGGSVVQQRSSPNTTWTVMQDPEGNEFCVN